LSEIGDVDIDMIQIDDVVVSMDVLREKFVCDLDACKGECCIEGDAGAPVELEEVAKLEEVLPEVWNDLSPEAQEIINRQGVVYTDCDGDLVTSIVNGKDCVFTCYDERGYCYCAIEKAYREGRVNFYKPVSCHLLGQKADVPVYKFLREPLIRKFGADWYKELEEAVEELKAQNYL
jgi:hypothetical protein